MDVLKTMRVGAVASFAGIPKDLPREKMPEYVIDRAIEFDLDVAQIMVPANMPDAYYDNLRGKCEAHGIELDVGATMSLFELTGDNAAKARQDLIDMVQVMKKLNATIMRRGYGRLSYETSRFNLAWPYEQHMQFLVDNLKEAEKILAPEGIYLAIENHCDFKGTEHAEIFKAVGSPFVGCALDTANGFTVYCDPIDEVRALAPYTITTHIKDMVVRRDKGWRIPFYPSGCALGEGNAEAEKAVKIIAENSPHAKGLHLIVENGWVEYEEGTTDDQKAAISKEMYLKGINFLKKMTGKI
ncbi:MAG: sugar phosphate isomerase/epimerase [Clostridiaceae bacterium]|jgi:sugar phosphate isomerase/epimerase|nr:sugar phosphate isomerase/epimerase [Clostridiaceae bacterium]